MAIVPGVVRRPRQIMPMRNRITETGAVGFGPAGLIVIVRFRTVKKLCAAVVTRQPFAYKVPNRKAQQGVALITILLVVVIATVLGVAMVRDQNTTILRTRNFFSQSQAMQYALGGEELARQILWQDFNEGEKIDTLADPWANQEMKFEFDEGDVRVQIEDMQSRLNVNSLAESGTTGTGANRGLNAERFTSLFSQIGVDRVFVDRIGDWIDKDDNVRQLGAEDYQYLGLDRPFRTSGQPMADLSELRLLLEMDDETYQKLLPYLSALPDPEAELNVNTAEAIVLQSISRDLSTEVAAQIIATRETTEGFKSVTEFLQSPEVAGMGLSAKGLGVQSAFFKVRIIARYQERFSYLTSIVQRDPVDGSTRVIYRNNSNKILPVVRKPVEDEDAVDDETDV